MAAHRKNQRTGYRGKHERKRQPGMPLEVTPRSRARTGKRRMTNDKVTAEEARYPAAA